jgi:hypothetical protein
VDKGGLLEHTIAKIIPLVYTDAYKESKLKCLLEDAIVTRTTNLSRCKVINTPEAEHMVSAFWNGVAVAAVKGSRNWKQGVCGFP